VVGKAGEVVLQRDTYDALPLRIIERPMAFEIDIETGRRRGDKNIERLARGASARASARTAGKAPSIEAASSGQDPISTISCVRACMNPVVGRP
jgi:hypothetical protein